MSIDDWASSKISLTEAQPAFQVGGVYPGTTAAWNCPEDEQFQSSSTYAVCCPGISCVMATKCDATSGYIDAYGSSVGCLEPYTCSTLSVLESSVTDDSDDQSTWLNIACFDEARLTAIYKAYPDLTSATDLETETGATATSDTAVTRTNPPNENDDDGREGSTNPSKNAWIAGPVIGSVALLVFAGILIFWIRKRSQKKDSAQSFPTTTPYENTSQQPYTAEASKWQHSPDQSMGTQSSPPPPPQWASSPSTERTEMRTGSRPMELPGSNFTESY